MEDLQNLLMGECLFDPGGGCRLVPVPAEGVVFLLQPILRNLPVEDGPDVSGVYDYGGCPVLPST
jgi:hypothetical protein